MNVCFEGLEEVACEIGAGEKAGCFGAWWNCMRDAAREGLGCKRGCGQGKALVFRYEFEGRERGDEILSLKRD